MESHIKKWGNSLGLRIPMQLANQLNLHQGSVVSIEIEDGRIVIQPPKYDLNTMLKSITSKNKHHQEFDDGSRGYEEW